MTYAAKTMLMTKREQEKVRLVEKKIMQVILGPTKLEENVQAENKIMQKLQREVIVRRIKKQSKMPRTHME